MKKERKRKPIPAYSVKVKNRETEPQEENIIFNGDVPGKPIWDTYEEVKKREEIARRFNSM